MQHGAADLVALSVGLLSANCYFLCLLSPFATVYAAGSIGHSTRINNLVVVPNIRQNCIRVTFIIDFILC